MFSFRYLGHFDLAEPFIKASDYDPAVPNVLRPISRDIFQDLLVRFPVDRAALKWCYGSIMSFLSLPGDFHPLEKALIQEQQCAALNMRLDVICRPGALTAPIVPEVWAEEDYLYGPRKYELRWCEEFYKRLVWSDDAAETMPPSRQGQLLSAATEIQYEYSSGGQRLEGAIDVFQAYSEFVLAHLCDGTFNAEVRQVCSRAALGFKTWLNGGEIADFTLSDDLDELVMLAYHWCRLHPEPLPPHRVMWENPAEPDEPAEADKASDSGPA